MLIKCIHNKGKKIYNEFFPGHPTFKIGEYPLLTNDLSLVNGRGWVTNKTAVYGPTPEWPLIWNESMSRWELDDSSVDCYFQDIVECRNKKINEILE